ncbi:MAG: hypothetical protein P1P87_02915 [Trueperaceae bacterium]|nr:hypothetical protein [Trueperaceae bacterium]
MPFESSEPRREAITLGRWQFDEWHLYPLLSVDAQRVEQPALLQLARDKNVQVTLALNVGDVHHVRDLQTRLLDGADPSAFAYVEFRGWHGYEADRVNGP